MRWFLLVFALSMVLFVGMWGWRGQVSTNNPIEVFPDMDHQYKVRFQQPSDFFEDGNSSRLPVPGTVSLGNDIPVAAGGDAEGLFNHDGDYYGTGLFGDYFGDGFPYQVELSESLLARGQERYGIYCVVCHGAVGDGNGIVGSYWPGGMLPPTANLVDGRVSAMPDGQIFWTITHGKGLMGPYSGNITIHDRWAIVAYLRALEKSRRADLGEAGVKEAFDGVKGETGGATKDAG